MDPLLKSIHRLPENKDGPQHYYFRTLLTADLSPAPAGEYGDGGRAATEDASDATLISSEIWMGAANVGVEAVEQHGWPEERLHAPALDLDFPCVLVPSSTKGHFHLYLNKPVPWSAYLKVLDAMVEAGLVEEGYVNAARRRGATHLRLPHIKKESEDVAEVFACYDVTDEEPF